MIINSVYIDGLKVIEPSVFHDDRGYFFESYNEDKFAQAGISEQFVQDNQSLSHFGVLRGLHFQTGVHAQAKLVRVISGSVIDVAVDLRKNSPTLGKYFSIELNDSNNLMFYIPVGFAHGFISLKNNTVFSYKCSKLYHKNAESGILWCDPLLNINWGVDSPVISTKDAILPKFNPKILYF
jgi:dTDP-4-dehydrorhamnose 3,5-epimerase